MTERIAGLRRLSLKLEVSGTAIAISNTTLYQGGFGFVLLSVLVPVTQNALGSPLLTVYRTTIDNIGQRIQYNNDNYTLLFVQYVEAEGFKYMLFEGLLPNAFTNVVGDLELVFNYVETKQVDNGDGTTKIVIVSRLTTNIFATTVQAGGIADTGIVMDDSSSLLANQVNANSIAITQLQDDLDNVINIVIPTQIYDHNHDSASHPYLIDLINSIDLGEGMTLPAVQNMIDASVDIHNTDTQAHEDIRQTVSDNYSHIESWQANHTDPTNVYAHSQYYTDIQQNTSSIANIETVIPSQASIDNRLVDRLTMIQAIITSTTRFLTYDSSGNPFPTFADLSSAIVWYYQGASTAPTNNDFTVVLNDENHDNATVQYSYDGVQWVFMFKVSDVAFTPTQWDAINSGATTTNIAQINTNTSNIATNTSSIGTLQTSKQDTLISGTNIKTINGNSLLGSGDITISGGGGGSGGTAIYRHLLTWNDGALDIYWEEYNDSPTQFNTQTYAEFLRASGLTKGVFGTDWDGNGYIPVYVSPNSDNTYCNLQCVNPNTGADILVALSYINDKVTQVASIGSGDSGVIKWSSTADDTVFLIRDLVAQKAGWQTLVVSRKGNTFSLTDNGGSSAVWATGISRAVFTYAGESPTSVLCTYATSGGVATTVFIDGTAHAPITSNQAIFDVNAGVPFDFALF